jgi:hypothetical protein
MNAPVRIEAATALDPDNLGCDQCCAGPVVEVIDGDRLCASCAPDPDVDYYGHPVDADELRRSLRGAGVYRGALIEARIADAELRRKA